VELGRALGLSQQQIDQLVTDEWRTSELFSDRDKAVVHWAEAVTNLTAHGDERGFADLKRFFDDGEIVELTFLASMWNLSNRFAEALHLVVEPPGQRITFQDLGE
jgi:alkylhydroperoxidase family enzyme